MIVRGVSLSLQLFVGTRARVGSGMMLKSLRAGEKRVMGGFDIVFFCLGGEVMLAGGKVFGTSLIPFLIKMHRIRLLNDHIMRCILRIAMWG